MVTNQIMKRDFMNSKISQRTKDSYFNATELLLLYNENSATQKRFFDFWENNSTKSFISELEAEIYNSDNSRYYKNGGKSITYETTRGKGGATWMHPYLFVKFAMWLSPKFELQIIKWVYDNLIDFRNQAGDHYKEMCAAINDAYEEYFDSKPSPLVFVKEANFLNKLVYGTYESGKRNELSAKELSLLNNLQKLNISLIKTEKTSKKERYRRLAEFANNQKLIESLT